LTFARSLCGCARVVASEHLTGDEADTERGVGEMLCERWGCPAGGHTPPTTLPDTAALPLGRTAVHVARAAGLSETPRTCPFACLERADALTIRVMRAVVRSGDVLRIPVAQSLPGGTTAADDQALDAYLFAHHAATRADDAARERERAKDPQP